MPSLSRALLVTAAFLIAGAGASWPARSPLPLYRLAQRPSPSTSLRGPSEPVVPLPGSNPLLNRLRHDVQDGRLDDFGLLPAALIAGGVDSPAAVHRYEQEVARWGVTLAQELPEAADVRTRLDHLLHQFQERVLVGEYHAEASALHQTLHAGEYNCVTATVLFQAVAARCGIPVEARGAPGHVLGYLPGEPELYVEMTSRPGRSWTWEECPALLRDLLDRSVSLTDAQLLSRVFYNVGVAQLAARDFPGAAESLRSAVQLDPHDRAARENLVATFNNWSLAECDRGNFSRAQELLWQGQELDPDYLPLRANDQYVHQRWAKELCERGDFRAASGLLDDACRRRPDVELFSAGRIAVYQMWAEHHFVRGNLSAGWQVLDECQARYGQQGDPARLIALIERACHTLQNQQQATVAAALVQEAQARHPDWFDFAHDRHDLLQAGL